MSGFYVAWTTPEGVRDCAGFILSEEMARVVVEQLNTTLPITGAHVVVPVEHIEAWKAGTWTKS